MPFVVEMWSILTLIFTIQWLSIVCYFLQSKEGIPVLTQRTSIFRQQAISALTDLNSTVFADGGAQFTKFGFEYWSNPSNRNEGFIDWVADEEVFRIDATTFAADQSVMISDRLISEEPMVRYSIFPPL